MQVVNAQKFCDNDIYIYARLSHKSEMVQRLQKEKKKITHDFINSQ